MRQHQHPARAPARRQFLALPAGIALEHAVARAVVSWQTSRMAQSRPAPQPGTGGPASRPGAAGSGRPRPGASRQIFLPPGGSKHHRVINLPGNGVPIHGGHGSLPPQLARLGTQLTPAYTPGTLALLVLAGLAIAIAGALGPAIWAAASKTSTALHAE